MNIHEILLDFDIISSNRRGIATIKSFGPSYYTYILCEKDAEKPVASVPYYVGKGRGHRCLNHFNSTGRYCDRFLFLFIRKAASEQEALDIEEHIIELFGRKLNGGILDNAQPRGSKTCKRPKGSNQFATDAKAVHGDKYDYSKVRYTYAREKVEIICKEHGSFWQTPNNHLFGKGCPSCAVSVRTALSTNGVETFITKAREAHGDKYDYSKSKYVTSAHKLEIICPKHGSFWQSPDVHARRGVGCPSCAIDRRVKAKTGTTESFISKAVGVHGYIYRYTNTLYIRDDEKVEIICPKHGSFWQTPRNHLQGKGCSSCAKNGKSQKQIL